MSFSWLHVTPSTANADRAHEVMRAELISRAGVLYRLGFSQADAARRLAAQVAWEYDAGATYRRPPALSDAAITQLVADTYARRPA
ncbi:MAG TPA: hypothetical protein VFP84_07280 [Kofleriaceae bacterium]|nr:hypothetical protein [Kofleriaceae bacterium]